MKYKQPRSVQVVIFSDSNETRVYLLLRRITNRGSFWQTVTGSLEENESHTRAAIREVLEETGIHLEEDQLIDLNLTQTFEIAPEWRVKYEPGVSRNEEKCFAACVIRTDIRLDPLEHSDHAWVSHEEAMRLLFWESSRRALTAAAAIPWSHSAPDVAPDRNPPSTL